MKTKLTPREREVLGWLLSECHSIARFFKGRWRPIFRLPPDPGERPRVTSTLVVHSLRDAGLISNEGNQSEYYSITDAGRKALEEN